MDASDHGTPRLRFRRAHRLVRGADFQRVFRQGSRAKGSLMTVAVAPSALPHPRLGLSIGKVVWRGAVGRNRVRRVFREAFRLEQHALPAGYDLVLIGSAPRIRPGLAETRRELVYLARKAARRYREKVGAE
ncbi:MAG: ribonuclease P protein component [Planctomycetota bacterium]